MGASVLCPAAVNTNISTTNVCTYRFSGALGESRDERKLTEALRAELQGTAVRVGIVFHDPAEDDVASLNSRLADALEFGQMYSLSADLPAERISGYFASMLDALSRTTSAPALPDIGPMAAVYDAARLQVPPL